MRVHTMIKDGYAYWRWDKKLKYVDGHSLYVKYPLTLRKVPQHIANFAFLVAFQDILVWNGGEIQVDELTEIEWYHLSKILGRNHNSKGCGGQDRKHRVPSEPPNIKPDKLVDEPLDLDDGVVVCNGYGKDGMNCALIAKELGYDPMPFTMLNQYKTDELLTDRLEASTLFNDRNGFDPLIAYTNIWEIVNKTAGYLSIHRQKTGFYPYAFALIAAVATNSSTILDGIQIHNNKYHTKTGRYYCPGETIFQFHDITKATGIALSSPLRPLSNYGSQKLLAERWPEYLEYQRSCMRGIPWCCRCAKCQRKALYLEEMGIPPIKVGLDPFQDDKLGLDQYGPVNDSVVQILAKLRNKPYNKWPWKSNDNVFPLIWEGDNIRSIYQEHFDGYNYDPPVDSHGWVFEPSKWRYELKL